MQKAALMSSKNFESDDYAGEIKPKVQVKTEDKGA
jgi:hypothetical protein